MAIRSLGNGVVVVHGGAVRVAAERPTRARAARAPGPKAEIDAIVRALRQEDVQVVKRMEITPAPRTRSGARAASDDVEINVTVGANEEAVVLVEQNGEYHWELPDGTAIGAERLRRMDRRRTRKKDRTVTFRVRARITVSRSGQRKRLRGLFGKVVALVLKFARKAISGLVIKHLEKDIKPGLVRIGSTEPEKWERLGDNDNVKLPDGRAPRVLLLVHGTFSSTVGSFSGLRHTPEGFAFLERALKTYDVVLGYDHRTLSEVPEANADQIIDRLKRIKWKETPQVDAIAFSRGGLVFRTVLEHRLGNSTLKLDFRNAVFVGCTNGGTLLAEPENWGKLVDTYTNLAAAAARGLSFVPQARAVATVLTVTVRIVGILVKYLASFIVNGGGVPGLAAMEPDGDVVTSLNAGSVPNMGTTKYHAVTDDYEPARAESDGSADQLPASWRMKLADGLVDRLMGEENDLVVNTAAMTMVGTGAFPGKTFALGKNGRTMHTTYFRDPKVVTQLGTWLLGSGGGGSRRRSRAASKRKRGTRRAAKK